MPPRPYRVCSLQQHRLMSAALCLLSVCVLGCGDVEQITRYAVPKEESSDADVDDIQNLVTDDGSVTAWIYKMLGPADAVSAQRETFDALVNSTVINNQEAEWTTPEGWSRQPGSGFRFATLVLDKSEPPLELSVTNLTLSLSRDELLLQNINRWRGQVGLPALSGGDWLADVVASGDVEQSEVEGQDVTVVSLEGETEEHGDSLMLAAIFLPKSAGRGTRPAAPAMVPPGPTPTGAESEPLTYAAPEEWLPGKKSMMRVAAFLVTEGQAQVEITVIPAGGNLLSNVNRWRGQIGLQPWNDAELKDNSEQINVSDATADYVHLEGADETILAAVLPDGEQSWFFKLMGNPALAMREEQRFRTFVASVRLTGE